MKYEIRRNLMIYNAKGNKQQPTKMKKYMNYARRTQSNDKQLRLYKPTNKRVRCIINKI